MEIWIDKALIAGLVLGVFYLLLRTQSRAESQQDSLISAIKAKDLQEYRQYHPEPDIKPMTHNESKQERIVTEHKDNILSKVPEDLRLAVSEAYDMRIADGADPLTINADDFIDTLTLSEAEEKL